jgi:hypothetical protein
MRDFRMSRRSLLRALGLGGVAALALPSLGRRAHAGVGLPPRRLALFWTTHGTVYDNWRMRPGGLPDDAPWEAPLAGLAETEFSEILRPLWPLRDRMLVADGLCLVSALGDIQGANGHDMGQAHSLTGAFAVQTGATVAGGGPSVDQIVAQAIGQDSPFPSLELGVGWTYGPGSVVYQGANQRLPAEYNPIAAFERLFPAGTMTPTPTDDDHVRAAQASVLDAAAGEFDHVAARLGAEDRARLEIHRDLVRDLEQRIRDRAALVCEVPPEPPMRSGTTAEWYPVDADSMFRLAAAALGCGLTNVVSFQMGQMRGAQVGAIEDDIHNAYAHTEETSPESRAYMTEYHRLHAAQLASFCQLLDALPEGSGSVLDNTLVVWCNELGTGAHSYDQWPIVMVGGAGGGVRPGRYLRWPATNPTAFPHPEWPGIPDYVGVPHNKLLVSICRAMGLSDVSQVGATTVTATNGTPIDLTGPLDGIA